MIRLRKVRQLEVDGEGFRHPMGLNEVETIDYGLRAIHQLLFIGNFFVRDSALGAQLAVFDEQQSQLLNRREELVSHLFLEYFTEQPTERSNIATQWCFLQISGVACQFSQPRCLIVDFPERFP
jgi:hypothetical protein